MKTSGGGMTRDRKIKNSDQFILQREKRRQSYQFKADSRLSSKTSPKPKTRYKMHYGDGSLKLTNNQKLKINRSYGSNGRDNFFPQRISRLTTGESKHFYRGEINADNYYGSRDLNFERKNQGSNLQFGTQSEKWSLNKNGYQKAYQTSQSKKAFRSLQKKNFSDQRQIFDHRQQNGMMRSDQRSIHRVYREGQRLMSASQGSIDSSEASAKYVSNVLKSGTIQIGTSKIKKRYYKKQQKNLLSNEPKLQMMRNEFAQKKINRKKQNKTIKPHLLDRGKKAKSVINAGQSFYEKASDSKMSTSESASELTKDGLKFLGKKSAKTLKNKVMSQRTYHKKKISSSVSKNVKTSSKKSDLVKFGRYQDKMPSSPKKHFNKKIKGRRFEIRQSLKQVKTRVATTFKKGLYIIKNGLMAMGKALLTLVSNFIPIIIILAFLIMVLISSLFTKSQYGYLMSDVEATKIEKMFSEKELNYLKKITNEAERHYGNPNVTVDFDPVGHDPHEMLSLLNVLLMPRYYNADNDRKNLDWAEIEEVIDLLISERYKFDKDVRVETYTIENEDGETEERKVEYITLNSVTTSFRSMTYDRSVSGSVQGVQNIIDMISPAASKVAQEKGFYASVLIAQVLLESGANLSELARPPHHNLLGIKGSYQGESVAFKTQEQTSSGQAYTITARFRSYPSYEACIADYGDLMSRPLYSGTLKKNTNSYRDATAWLTGTYATDVQYNTKLNRIIEQYGLTKYDSSSVANRLTEKTRENDIEEVEEKREMDLEELVLTGNLFSMNDYERELFNKQYELKGLMGVLSQPVENIDWGDRLLENYGWAWNKSSRNKYETSGIKLNMPSYKSVLSQLSGRVRDVNQSNGHVEITIGTKDGSRIKYGNLSQGFVVKGDPVNVGDIIGQTSEEPFTIELTTGRVLKNEIAPTIVMNTDNFKPLMYDSQITLATQNAPSQYRDALTQRWLDQEFDQANVNALFNEAKKYIGYPYVFGGSSPATSFDCSGYVSWVYMHTGLGYLPRTTANVMYNNYVVHISEAEARPGDLIFFDHTYPAGEQVTHVGFYVGNGVMLHAGSPIGFESYKHPYWQSHNPRFGRVRHNNLY